MRLLRLHVENFGTLRNFDMEFSKGLNTIHHENGWGKSTLAVFIKAMLYGLPATRAKSLDEKERVKYTPWQGGAYGGSLEFETARGRFRIERRFGKKESDDEVALYDLSTNRPTTLYKDPFGEALFAIDADGFERTVYLSQRSLKKSDPTNITARLGELLDDVDDIGSYEGAIAALDKRRQFYVKTGNRGHIAELEEELNNSRGELGKLQEKQETLISKETEYAAQQKELADAQKALKTVREDLRRAGLLRERRANEESKGRMLGALSEIHQKRQNAEQTLGGVHPTDEELERARNDLQALRDAKAEWNAVPKEPVRRRPLHILSESMAESVPKNDVLGAMKQHNRALEDACRREDMLLSSQPHPSRQRFANGAPTEQQINAAYRSFSDAQNAERDAAAALSDVPQAGVPVVGILLLIVGAVLAALAFLPALAGFLIPMLIVAALCAVGSVIVFVLHASQKKRVLREREATVRAHKQRAQSAMSALKGFLARYGLDASDPMRQLGELAADVRNFSDAQERIAQANNDRRTLEEQKRREYAFLIPNLKLFGIERGEQRSYQTELEDLSADLSMLEQVRSDEETRRRKLATAENAYREAQNRIKPFLDRFDPHRTASNAEEVLRRTEDAERMFREADRDYANKDEELRRFIQEKHLDEAVEDGGIELDYDELSNRERDLQEQVGTLLDQTNNLRHEIDGLSDDTEYIGDVTTRIGQLTEALEEATQNSETIQKTAEFLKQAKDGLSTRYLDDMQKSLSHFLSLLSAGEAPVSTIDSSFEISLRADDVTRPMESFSRGWRDAVQFCMRLSLTEALYGDGEKPFLLLDDPFVNLDDRRLAAARRLLDALAENYQIVYMVCHADRG